MAFPIAVINPPHSLINVVLLVDATAICLLRRLDIIRIGGHRYDSF